jgi:anthranilate phosphoribosyltransferase
MLLNKNNEVEDLINFSTDQFVEIFSDIFNQKYSDEIIEDFLNKLNQANLPLNSLIGAVEVLKQRMIKINAPKNCLDLCGTGGDQLNTLNISTAVSFILATQIHVAKHGNKAISSLSGSADIFQELLIPITDDKNILEKNLISKKLIFLFAPYFHPSLKIISSIRKKIKQPTIFNFLGPLLNPAQTNFQLLGTSRLDTIHKIAMILSQNPDNHSYVVHGLDGMDEISLSQESYLVEVKDGKIFQPIIIDPKKYRFKLIDHQEIIGKDPKYNANQLINLLNAQPSSYRNIVVLNSAFALRLINKVKSIEDGIELAQAIIDSKQALKIYQDLVSQ